jgi:hypothetical protein
MMGEESTVPCVEQQSNNPTLLNDSGPCSLFPGMKRRKTDANGRERWDEDAIYCSQVTQRKAEGFNL